MRTPRFLQTVSPLVVAGVVSPGAAWAGDWWLQAGPAYRAGMTVKVSGTSRTQQEGVHAAPAPPGAQTGYADREYDDGYVKLDAGTLDPNAVGGPGLTWNWAYDRADQYSAANQTLTFRRTYERAYQTTGDTPLRGEDEFEGLGLSFQFGRTLRRGDRWLFDLALGFHGFWDLNSSVSASSYQEQVGPLTVADRFDVRGAVHPELGFAPPRTAPGGYTGTYDGPAGESPGWAGGYPVIPNVPVGGVAQMEVASIAANQVTLRFSQDLYEITLSPRISYRLSQSVTAYLIPKVGVAIAMTSAERSETFSEGPPGGAASPRQTWSETVEETDALFTCGVAGGVEMELGSGFHLGAFGGYDWVLDSQEFDLGPNQIRLDNSGWSVGLVLRKEL
jgi:hypothetical protein